jgi:predicted Zn-dependent protease
VSADKRRHCNRVFRVICLLSAASLSYAQRTEAERLIEAGHWKRARLLVEARIRETPDDPLATFLLSQVRAAFGERSTPLLLAERAVSLDARTARYHRQLAEMQGLAAQHANALQQLLIARRFRKEIDAALALDPRDVQAHRDLLEFYLLAPGIVGGDRRKAAATADRIAGLDAAEGFLAQARVSAFQKRDAETEALLRKAVAAQPPSYQAPIALAQFYLESSHRDVNSAERLARQAIKLRRDRVEAYAVLAQVYAERCAWTELESTLADAVHEVPDDRVPFYRAAAWLLAGGRDLERAERYLRFYLGQEPEGNEPTAAEAAQLLNLGIPAVVFYHG